MNEQEYFSNLPKLNFKEWSEPLYECPKCGNNTVCRNEMMVLTSLPPKYRYKCLSEIGGCGEYSTYG